MKLKLLPIVLPMLNIAELTTRITYKEMFHGR